MYNKIRNGKYASKIHLIINFKNNFKERNMKKKIFLIGFMVVALLSVFAISAFAEEIIVSKTESEEYGTIIQLNADPGLDNAKQYVSNLKKISDVGTDKDSLCILTDGAETPSYYVFPSSYIVDEREDGVFDIIATQLAAAIADFNTANETSYYAGYVTDGSGGGKRLNSIVRFAFPSSVTSASDSVCCMRSYSKLVEIRINQAIDFSNASKMFYSNTKLATVIGFELVDGTKLPKTMFAACSALRYIKLPINTVKIPGSFFQGAKGVNIVNMEELTQLTTIDSWAFDGTQNLVITLPDSVTTLNTSAFESAFKQGGSITINPTSQLTTIGNKAFAGSAKLKSIYIPSTVTTIGENAFNGSGVTTLENFENCQITTIKKGTFEAVPSLTSIKIPETVTTIEKAFLGNKSLKKVYIPDSVTSINADNFIKSAWEAAPANIVVLYTGNNASTLLTCTGLASATVISAGDYDETKAYEGVNLVVGYSKCIAYNNGVHGEGVNDIVFKSFVEVIQKVSTCSECGMKEVVGVIPALFECKGCSASMTGVNGIVVGFTANVTAISEYEKETGKTIKYGVFAISQSNLDGNDVFDENGNAAYGAICAEVTASLYASAFDVKVVGFTDDKKDFKLAFGAYIEATKGDNTEYSYIQDDTKGNYLNGYYYVSYNDIVK